MVETRLTTEQLAKLTDYEVLCIIVTDTLKSMHPYAPMRERYLALQRKLLDETELTKG